MADAKESDSDLPQRSDTDTEIDTIKTTSMEQSNHQSALECAAETQSGGINNAGEEIESMESHSQSQPKSIVPNTNELDTSGNGEQPLSDSLPTEKHKTTEVQVQPAGKSDGEAVSALSIISDEVQPTNSDSATDLSQPQSNEGFIHQDSSSSTSAPELLRDTNNKSPNSDNENEGDSEIWFDSREDTASVSDESVRAASAASVASEVLNKIFTKVEEETQSPISGDEQPLIFHREEIPPPPDFEDESDENNDFVSGSPSPTTTTSRVSLENTIETVNSCSTVGATSLHLHGGEAERKGNRIPHPDSVLLSTEETNTDPSSNIIPTNVSATTTTTHSSSSNTESQILEKNECSAVNSDSSCTNKAVDNTNGVVDNSVNETVEESGVVGRTLGIDSSSGGADAEEINDIRDEEVFSSDEDYDEEGELLNLETGGGGGGRASHNSGRRSSFARRGSVCEEGYAEDSTIMDFLVDVQDGAEARLAARRQARAEAREIRMKELEKQQKESEENADRHYDMYSTGNDVANRAAFRVALGSHRGPSHSVGSGSYHSSRRSSEDSSEDGIVNIRDMRHELKELEDKFRKSMVQNAQLDNEKSALTYHVELLKDKIDDLEESLSLLQREHKDKCRDFENLKRLSTQLKDELEYYKSQLQEKDELIKEYGLVVVESEVEVDLGNGERETRIKKTLVTQQTAQVLSTLGDGSLDVRLKKVLEEKNELLDEIRRLKLDLEEERNRNAKGDRAGGLPNNISHNSSHTMNGPDGHDSHDTQREASKQMADYRFKTQKYEQEITTLQANVARLETQVARFKTAAEEAESREDDLKVEKRKLQREFREAQSKVDELETTNSHLQKRLDKLKTAKSTLLKEL